MESSNLYIKNKSRNMFQDSKKRPKVSNYPRILHNISHQIDNQSSENCSCEELQKRRAIFLRHKTVTYQMQTTSNIETGSSLTTGSRTRYSKEFDDLTETSHLVVIKTDIIKFKFMKHAKDGHHCNISVTLSNTYEAIIQIKFWD